MSNSMGKKWFWIVLAVGLSALAITGVLDRAGSDAADQAFKRALVSFAAARALNGAISVAQGTELAVEPGGVGVIVAIGQALDPINDLVEQFSTVMLVATSSLGLQKLLIGMTEWWGVTLALCIVAASFVATLVLPSAALARFSPLCRRLFLLFVFIRFALPVLTIGTGWVFDNFLASEQAAATAAIEATTEVVENINTDETPQPDEPPEELSLFDRIDSALDEALDSLDFSDRLERVQNALSNASEHVINLIVIFLLQTIVLPIIFIWLLAEGLKGLGSKAFNVSSN